MQGKKYRLSRIFREDTGRTVVLPIDHGVTLGDVPGLEKPSVVLERLVPLGVDAVLIGDGVIRHTGNLLAGRHAPARLLNADSFYMDADASRVYHSYIATPEQASARGYDAAKLLLLWDQPADERRANVERLADFVRLSERAEMPVILEPTLVGTPGDSRERSRLLSDAVRVAYELGADILKVPHPGDEEMLARWCDNYPVPIILLGGGSIGSLEEVAGTVRSALLAGARGVAIGRNVWQRPEADSRRMMKAFVEAVHGAGGQR